MSDAADAMLYALARRQDMAANRALGFIPCPKWHANEDGEGGSTPARELLSPPGCPGCGARM